jgi:hypothetical protein
VRTASVLVLLGFVLGASVLDLALGILWVAALVVVLLLRRRIRLAAWLVLLAVGALLAWGGHLGWFPPPAPVSYERGWIPGWGGPPSVAAPVVDRAVQAARAQLAALAREELRLTGPELEQRAGALVTLARRLDPLRGEASREVALLEGAARRLARTLAAPEFRDLEARRSAAGAYVADLERRLGAARDAEEAGAIMRAADPAAMAHVSLRPVREDLAVADAATEAVVRLLGGGVPTVTATAAADYDEARSEIRWEVRYVIAGAPRVRLLRLEARPFRTVAPAGKPLALEYAEGAEAVRPMPPGAWVDLDPAPRGVAVTARWTDAALARPIAAKLRPLSFGRIEIVTPSRADDVMLVAVLDGRPGLEWPLAVRLPSPYLARVTVPHHALHFASHPGAVSPQQDGDRWEPAGEGPERLAIELVPRTFLLRNDAFARVRGYLYRPNTLAVAGALGLAAMTLVMVRRPRSVGPASR